MKKIFKWLLPLLVLVLGVGFLFFNDYYLKPNLNTEEILVVNKNISFTEKLTEDDISVEKINKDQVVEGALTPSKIEQVINKRASIDIPKGTQLHQVLLDEYELVPNEEKGEFVAPIPESWLYAVAGTMRKGYVADFYVVGGSDSETIERLLEDSKELDGNNYTEDSSEEQGEESEEETTNEENTEEITTIVQQLRDPVLKNVRVASVRDKSNAEVITSNEQTSTATGSIANLEIIANEEMLNTIQNYINDGYQLYVVYRYDIVEDDEKQSEENKEGEEE
jgi:SAF domain